MGPPSDRGGDSIIIIIGVKASAALQVTRDGGSSDNDIFMEKADGRGDGISVYCSCWDALLGISRT